MNYALNNGNNIMITTHAQKSEMEKKLLQLDKDVLVKALIEASFRDDVTSSVIERLTSDRHENVSRFRSQLKDISNQREYITWKYTHRYAREVEDLLEDVREGCSTSKEGLELLKLFFESDGPIIECCDDSSGEIGNVFRYNATELFEEYAKQCEDKEYLSNLLFDLILNNGYGLRDGLTENIDSFLPESHIRSLVEKLWKRYHSTKKKDSFYSSELGLLEEMANALKDPLLLEKILKTKDSKNEDYDNFRMGRIWLKAGDHNKALEYLEKVDRKSSLYLNELNDILTEAYKKAGDTENVKKIAWSEFKAYRTKEHFSAVIKLEGKDKKSKILDNEIKEISNQKGLKSQSVDFLLEMNLVNEANDYVLNRDNDLDGNAYYCLPSWAKKFEKNKHYLVCVLIYRALLDSILARAYSKAYHHGVDYLKKLESLSPKVNNWGKISSHATYFDEVQVQHKRKSSFWARYRGER